MDYRPNATASAQLPTSIGSRRPYPTAPPGSRGKRSTPLVTKRNAALLLALLRRRWTWRTIDDLISDLDAIRVEDPHVPEIAPRTVFALVSLFAKHGVVERMNVRRELFILREQPTDDAFARTLLVGMTAYGFRPYNVVPRPSHVQPNPKSIWRIVEEHVR